ncbi:hypothetical protein KL86DES1_21844 [uncultured Desulfovibrio sp.]|uniref:Uncharacterized protein n=1 Tax=uncultured Desulfovibrio sp. TaxID=167968 RepID=A0A212L9U4_9BACT|nr:hypothetical protein KL86DES1_21841 [uncultured Desulfovibrio sp.]SCM74283.1 hypothetical protein KL86DES1_21844 [uncultured Desulfovibrio sp.]VZH34740.1 conserved protein of unknown function [Desulfovibrio sp. 86]
MTGMTENSSRDRTVWGLSTLKKCSCANVAPTLHEVAAQHDVGSAIRALTSFNTATHVKKNKPAQETVLCAGFFTRAFCGAAATCRRQLP